MNDDGTPSPAEQPIEVIQDASHAGGVIPEELEGGPEVEAPGGESVLALPPTESTAVVERTGIALVHAGEYILPAHGSEAILGTAMQPSAPGHVVNYYFPVEIEVVGGLSDEQLRVCADFVYDELLAASRARIT